MKGFILYCHLLLYISLACNGQVKWGAKQKNKLNNGSKPVLAKAEDEDNIYIIKKNNVNFAKEFWVVEAVSKKSNELVFSTYLQNPVNAQKQTTQWNAIIAIGSKLYLFSYLYDSNRILHAYATVVDKGTGLNGETKLIYTASLYNKDIASMQYALSPDKNKLLLSCSPLDVTNDELKIIDEDLNIVWKGRLPTQEAFKTLYSFHGMLDNNNNIVIWVNTHELGGPMDAKIIVYLTNSGQSKTIHVPVPEAFDIYCEMLKLYDSTKVYFAALLTTRQNQVTRGIISAMIDIKKQEYLNTQTTIFNDPELDASIGVDRGWGTKFMGLFYLKDIFFRPNKTLTILTEQEYRNENVLHPGNLILALNLSLRGYLNWMQMIPKYHSSSVVEEYLSFAAMADTKNVFLVYNVNLNMADTLMPELMQDPHTSVAVVTGLDDSGNFKTTPFYWSDQNLGMAIKPRLCSPLKTSLLLFSESEYSFKLGEIPLH